MEYFLSLPKDDPPVDLRREGRFGDTQAVTLPSRIDHAAIVIIAALSYRPVAACSCRSETGGHDDHASGTFDVKLNPRDRRETRRLDLGRMSLDKQFHGDLEGTSTGEMLTAGTSAVKDSAGYVAIERVTGRSRAQRHVRAAA